MNKCYLVSYNGLSNAGGVERVCYYVSKIVEQKGYAVKVVDKDTIENYWLGKLVAFFFGKVPLLASCVLSSIYVIQKKKRGAIVITNGFNCPLACADILFIHGTMKGHNTAIGVKKTFRSNLPIVYEKWAVNNAKNIIAVSHLAVQETKKFYQYQKGNFLVVNNMVDEHVYFPIAKAKDDVLKIVFCGRVEIRKGMDKLLELAHYIDMNSAKAKLIIATNNDMNIGELEKCDCVNIHVGLQQHQLNAFYNQGDVMYFPSMYEGFEMVTLEALSAGVPVLGNHVGAVLELYDRKELGVDIIKSPNNPADVLAQLKQQAEKYLTFKAKQKLHNFYAEHYGIDAYIHKLDEVFTKITK